MTLKEWIKDSGIPKDRKFIFGYIITQHPLAMNDIGINNIDDAKQLDIDYIFNHSGDKQLSNIIEYFMNNNTITETLSKLADLMFYKFYENWKRKYDAFYSEYNPIQNYSMTESESVNSNINTHNTSSIYAFNSTTAVPTDASSGSTSGLDTQNKRALERSGNIGVTTTQQMIDSTLKLYQTNLFDLMFRDIDSVICLEIY